MTGDIDRRALLTIGSLLAACSALPTPAEAETESEHMRAMMAMAPDAPKVAMLIYRKMVALDLLGPMTIFNILRFNVQLVWKDKNPVSTDVGIPRSRPRFLAAEAVG
jgi:cyclohexyl-isocyanide hydratase